MGLSTMRPKEVRKGSQIPAKGRIDVFTRIGMQNSSSSLTQKGSNGRCQKTPVTGRPVMLVRSVAALPPGILEKGMKATQYRELPAQLLTVIEPCSTRGQSAASRGSRHHPSPRRKYDLDSIRALRQKNLARPEEASGRALIFLQTPSLGSS